jgi:hypothetical protein
MMMMPTYDKRHVHFTSLSNLIFSLTKSCTFPQGPPSLPPPPYLTQLFTELEVLLFNLIADYSQIPTFWRTKGGGGENINDKSRCKSLSESGKNDKEGGSKSDCVDDFPFITRSMLPSLSHRVAERRLSSAYVY